MDQSRDQNKIPERDSKETQIYASSDKESIKKNQTETPEFNNTVAILKSLLQEFNVKPHEAFPTGCSEKPPLHRSCGRLRAPHSHSGSFFARVLQRSLWKKKIRCIRSPACPTVSDTAVDTGSESATEDLEEAGNRGEAPANGNANEANAEREAHNAVDEEEEEEKEEGDGEEQGGDEGEEAEAATGKRAAEDDEDDDADTKKQKTNEND
ncbi:PREDICTED: protein FAM9A-like [Miniopterus natalensis]|uniref:protein FAM9A-like n=1 Tax=Miniopterus natalensis TaxID=291302 RepID=UPI0007A71E5C|nr:PREDICTED: protein FAM9A-like [Miniopterus natalensis]